MARRFSYAKRDFASLREEQFNYIKRYYPEVVQNFNDGSILSVLLDLNAGIADNLHYHIDRSLQETVLDFAQQRASIYNIAKTYGLQLPTRTASMAVCEFSVEVPVFGDAEDKRYLPVLKAGTKVRGNGFTFELKNDLDFRSPTNVQGAVDRTKTPNFRGNKLVSYTITKQGIIVNGTTKVYRQTISAGDIQPFFQIILPEKNVLTIEDVISKNGTNFTTNPSFTEFKDQDLKWYEVPSLAEDRVFIPSANIQSDMAGVVPGEYVKTDRRFIKEFTPENFCVVTFGSDTDQSKDILDDFVQNDGDINLKNFLDNVSLGVAPEPNTTMFIKYRIGGGSNTNVGANVLNTVGEVIMDNDGPNSETVSNVRSSLTVNNITPAVGGADQPSMDELRYFVSYNFASQQRAVTLNDYKTLIKTMPSKFGTPARISIAQEQNKIKINILSFNNQNKFTNFISSTLMTNISNYLSKFRMINDYIFVKPGQVVDLGVEVNILIEDENQNEIVSEVIEEVSNVFSNANMDMGKNVYIGSVSKAVNNVSGVLNIEQLRFIDKVGGQYSNNEISQPYSDSFNRVIDTSDGILYTEDTQILQVRFPEKDIVVRAKLADPTRTG